MKTKIGINGLGRIGRMVVRSIFEEEHSNLKIHHINNRADIETACALLKRDSIHGKFIADISIEKNYLNINGNKIYYSQREINWKKLIGKTVMLILYLNVLVNLILRKS